MCTIADSKKKKNEFFIRPVNKIIKILAHLSSFSVSLSVTLSSPQSFFFAEYLPSHSLISLSLKQTSLPLPIASRLTPPITCSSKPSVWSSSKPPVWSSSKPSVWSSSKPRVWSYRSSPIASRRLTPHLTPPIACSSSRRSKTHGARQRAACLWFVIFYFVCNRWICLVW